jgi:hypothetical protein
VQRTDKAPFIEDNRHPLPIELLTFNYAYESRLTAQPGKAGSPIRRSTSIGSPSGAIVCGRKPKPYGDHAGRKNLFESEYALI